MGASAQTKPEHQACQHCCPRYHEAVELVGKRWTGAILYVLLHGGRQRFTEIANAVPDLSDRLLSERMKELEARDIVERHVSDGTPTKVSYELTEKGRQLAPALAELIRKDDHRLADSYSETALRRVWRCTHFSWWMTTMLHRGEDPFDEQLQLSQLRWVTSSVAGATGLAENYAGLPIGL